jgi:CRP/FNR family transcriptional regulator, cyclic AMP receptor protein
MDEQELLRSVPIFSELGEADFSSLAKVANRRRYPKDSVVFFENEQGDFFFMILEGRIKVTILGDDGREIILSMLGPGDFFGEMAMMGDGRRVADVVATSPITLVEMFGTHFRELEMILPEVASRIRATLEERRAAL